MEPSPTDPFLAVLSTSRPHVAILGLAVLLLWLGGCGASPDTEPVAPRLELLVSESPDRVDISVDGRPLTSYLFDDSVALLKKPVLYPIWTSSGRPVTRGYPLSLIPGERADHPHQVGSWMNHGDVNDLDFWNNSGARPREDSALYGTIRHREIVHMESNGPRATLTVGLDWLRPDGTHILDERTTFEFAADGAARTIDRTTTWTALDDTVVIQDSKEGLFAIRVAKPLEHASDRSDPFVASGDSLTEPMVDSSYATGHYRSSEGIEGKAVWGTRAKWTMLSGDLNGEAVTLAIFDHPENLGYPTYWMARPYGLFSANPLGAAVYSNGAESSATLLAPRESITFRYRLLVYSGSVLPPESIEAYYAQFIRTDE